MVASAAEKQLPDLVKGQVKSDPCFNGLPRYMEIMALFLSPLLETPDKTQSTQRNLRFK